MNSRKTEWLALANERIDVTLNDDQIEEILKLEDELSEGNQHISILHDRGLLTDDEFGTKLALCYDVFLKAIESLIGRDLCRRIYDYNSGERIDFVERTQTTFELDCLDNTINKVLGSMVEHSDPVYIEMASMKDSLSKMSYTATNVRDRAKYFIKTASRKPEVKQFVTEFLGDIESLNYQTYFVANERLTRLSDALYEHYRHNIVLFGWLDEQIDNAMLQIEPKHVNIRKVSGKSGTTKGKNRALILDYHKVRESLQDIKDEMARRTVGEYDEIAYINRKRNDDQDDQYI